MCAVILTSGCTRFGFPGVFKVDVAQGNIVTKDMVETLRLGMTQDQVRYVMGTPLLTDTFKPNRWDYFYSFKDQGNTPKGYRVQLQFENDLLVQVDSTAEDIKQWHLNQEDEKNPQGRLSTADQVKRDMGVNTDVDEIDTNRPPIMPPGQVIP
ncbi:MAG: outer membrane protein assembly factor BamE [Pseudomonadota bacterium]